MHIRQRRAKFACYGYKISHAPYTLHLSRGNGDRWDAMDPATLSLHLITGFRFF